MMMFKTFTGKTFNTASDANAWLNSMKKTGRYTTIHNAEGKKIAWVNSKYGDDKFLDETKNAKTEERKVASFEDFANGKMAYKGIDSLLGAFGEIAKTEVTTFKNGHAIYKTLTNGMTIEITRDEFMQDNGTYNSILKCIICEVATDRKPDIYMRVSYNGEYVAWAFSSDFFRTITCHKKDGRTVACNYYHLAGIQKLSR